MVFFKSLLNIRRKTKTERYVTLTLICVNSQIIPHPEFLRNATILAIETRNELSLPHSLFPVLSSSSTRKGS